MCWIGYEFVTLTYAWLSCSCDTMVCCWIKHAWIGSSSQISRSRMHADWFSGSLRATPHSVSLYRVSRCSVITELEFVVASALSCCSWDQVSVALLHIALFVCLILLANVVITGPSSVVCNVRRPTQAIEIFGNWYLGHLWPFDKILRRSSQGNPSGGGGVKTKRVAEYSDFGPF